MIKRAMLPLALGTIAVSRRLQLEADMANSSSNAPGKQRRSSGDGSRPSTPQTVILDDFADNNI
jgi:hypothetical protein